MYKVSFYFNTTESSLLGSMNGNKQVEVNEETKDYIVEMFQNGTQIIPISISENVKHYLNMKNVNYMAVEQVAT
jgi:hypothetical protein